MSAPNAPQDPPVKKRRRPALACEQCRRRKVRCDRTSPCNHCSKSENPEQCTYVPIQVPKQKRAPRPGAATIGPVSILPAPAPTPPESQGSTGNFLPVLNSSSTPATVSESGVSDVRTLERKFEGVILANGQPPGSTTESIIGEGTEATNATHRIPKTRYYGQSHWMNGLSLLPAGFESLVNPKSTTSNLHTLLSQCKILGRRIKEHRLQSTLSSSPLVSLDIPRSTADRLLDLYISSFEPVFPIMHIPSFKADYDRYWSDPGQVATVFRVQLQLVLALGACLFDDTFTLRNQASRWVNEAQLWLLTPPEKSRITIHSIQIMILLTLARSVCGKICHLAAVRMEEVHVYRLLWPSLSHFPLRLKILRHANDFRAQDSYSETLRLNSELVQACHQLSETLKRHSSLPNGTVVTQFHASLAELLAYRCFHTLHQPVIVRSLSDPKYYFSQKMYIDGALKIAHISGLAGVGVDENNASRLSPMTASHGKGVASHEQFPLSHHQSNDTRASGDNQDGLPNVLFTRLLTNGAGMFRNIPIQATLGIIVEFVSKWGDNSATGRASSGIGCLPGIHGTREADFAALASFLNAARGWTLRRIRSGEVSIKGHYFLTCYLLHVSAIEQEIDKVAIEGNIMAGAVEAAEECVKELKSMGVANGLSLEMRLGKNSEDSSWLENTEFLSLDINVSDFGDTAVDAMDMDWMGGWPLDGMSDYINYS
ncbi:uncharacterized protein NECHADRAFT_82908 [Fusarium vanettenii 77-13-4]|uniref:Zn(2)-C6 fungal-type domain-containing protein n=1 Tax=Fusarium vanettenii (strain ATCC MYA-4622 / CBS 123669 / FGSC 9596 / NRRL 45880 / 77-13-4) TaxID=660122 RepID=C7YX65_FUSV7|nr:uncharacterized protein NECHADRAFT_82908 [Fusarium vanettenii 77-13-4]EEU43778.1 hypothetical protein NECHADRAFT_82908 [Fusarium vanettenii 77-13-4]